MRYIFRSLFSPVPSFFLAILSDLFGKRVVENKDRRISPIYVKKKRSVQLVDTEPMSRFK
jgi:hypothetical protein